MKYNIILSLLFVIFVFNSCETIQSKMKPEKEQSDYDKIINSTWVLADDNEIYKNYNGSDITLKFDPTNNSVGGFSGCNQYFCNQYIMDNWGNLRFGVVTATKKYCPDNKIESTYLNLLSSVSKYALVNDELIFYKGDLELLTFLPQKK